MNNSESKGFTLIELLVVVAIIGILATIVLSSLGEARSKSKDAAIKQILSQMRAQAELQYLEDGNYNNICDSGTQTGTMFRDAYVNRGNTSSSFLGHVCIDENGRLQAFGTDESPQEGYSVDGPVDSNGSRWAASLPLSTGDRFCVDSLGSAIITSSMTINRAGPDKTC